MVKKASCPTKEDLIRLNHGDLPGDQLESVCDHVEVCEKCQLILGQLDEPPNEIGKQLAKITQSDLENARIAIEEETLQDRATTIWGQLAPSQQKGRDSTLDVPCNLRQYEVLKLIGSGGMGEVYEGRHSNLKRPVALKVIHGIRQDDPVAYEHFLREMETAGQLEHPNLVRAYDAWEHDGCLFLAQELLDGDSLQELASQGLIRTPEEIIDALLGTCRALEQLHAKGFVHRDVKPGNIMRLTDGTIKLIDYGLAIAAESGKSAARIGAGTVGYMSPEQAHGSGPVDYRSDIYSTGRVLKYLLTKLPADTNSPKRVNLIKILSQLANRLTEKDPQKRPKNIYSVVVKLEQLQQSIKSQQKKTGSPAPSSDSGTGRQKTNRPGNSTKSERKRTAAPEPQIAPQSQKKRVSPWLYLIALVLGMGSFGAYQLIFKTDRQATILVENHQPGDVIQITSEDGKVRSVELSDQAKFVVAPGSYKLSLEGPGNRQLTPDNITVKGRDQLNVQINDRTTGANANPINKKTVAKNEPFKLEMVELPAGSFVMGSVEGDPDARSDEQPRRKVSISKPIHMSAYEITVGQFREFVEATGYVTEAKASGEGGWKASRASSYGEHDPDFNWANPGYSASDSYPVTMVTYADAMAFCNWLSKRNDRVYRLPTEAEWEYACRAGTNTTYHFPIESRDSYCWSLWNTKNTVRPRPVGTRQPNAWGLYDMSGNVREWCQDWYSEDAYRQEYSAFPSGPSTGTMRVIRGGCFMDLNSFLRSSRRGFLEPRKALNTQGFRVVEGELSLPASDLKTTNNSPESSSPATPASAPSETVGSQSAMVPKTSLELDKIDDSAFVPLFNGKDLDNWELDRRFWWIENGVLYGDKSPKAESDTYAATKEEFEDFILKLKFKLKSGDSGIQFRGHLLPDLKKMTGSQLNISYEENMDELGQLYVNNKTYYVLNDAQKRELTEATDRSGWNECVIAARGDQIWASINGIVVVNQEHQNRKSGSIGLQLHKGGANVAFKDIMIKKIK